MKKLRQILALAGVILLVGMYVLTLVFALMKNPAADRLLMAAVFCTIAVPVLLYAMILVARRLSDRGEELRRDETGAAKPTSPGAAEGAAKPTSPGAEAGAEDQSDRAARG